MTLLRSIAAVAAMLTARVRSGDRRRRTQPAKVNGDLRHVQLSA
jgi:hypothetical protein